jgi:hypothetical protein
LRAAGQLHGHFFTEKKVGMLAEDFPAFDGVVVRKGYDGHAPPLTVVIHSRGLVVRLLAESGKTRSVAHARSGGMEMKVAAHGPMLDRGYEQSMKSAKNEHERWHGTY